MRKPLTVRYYILINLFAALFSILIMAPVVWMLALDRAPPYERFFGKIEPEYPAPGETVKVTWHVREKRVCSQVQQANLTRKIIDAHNVVWQLDNVQSNYKREPDPVTGAELFSRNFALPSSISPGIATYISEACFACNVLQDLVMPVCVSQPSIIFEVRAK